MKAWNFDNIQDANQDEFEAFFADIVHPRIITDPIGSFVKSQGFINFEPTPAQTVALKIVFKQPLDPITEHEVYEEVVLPDGGFNLILVKKTEPQIYMTMTGRMHDPEFFEKIVINCLDLICGRRSGKSTLASILAIFCAIKINWKPFLSKTPSATVLVLSHTKEFSEEILDILRTIVELSPVLNRLKDLAKKDSQSTFNLKVPFRDKNGKMVYSRVTIKVGAASKRTTRGKAVCTLLADETCFWGSDEGSKETDEEIFRAVRPSLLQFGEHGSMFKLSSPGIKQGVLYNEHIKWLAGELPANYVVFKSPSWFWNTTLPVGEFAKEYLLDPVGFATEFRADFVDSISNFILPEFVDLCVQRGITFLPPEPKGTDVVYTAAIDAAFKNDRFTFTLVGSVGGKIRQYIMKGWEGSRKTPVSAHEVAEYIQKICQQYGISRVHADQFAFQPLREIFDKFGITLEENVFTNKFKQQIYFNLKKLIHNQQLDILDNKAEITEIKQLQVEQSSTGTVKIGHPVGGHDDYVAATAVATYLLTENMGKVGIDQSEVAADPYGIPVDSSGRAFKAPSPEMLGTVMNSPVYDNSMLFEKDPETGEIRLRQDLDELDGSNEDGSDFILA